MARTAHEISNELWRDGKGWILITVSAGWFLSIGVRFTYPSILPFLRTAFGMDLSTAGLLLSTLWMAYAIGQFPGGVLGDRFGEGNILVYSTAISTAAIVLVVAAMNVWVLFIATFMFGFATALYGPHRFTIFTDIYDDRAGTAVGMTMAAGSIGNTVLPAVAATIAAYATWRLGFGVLLPLFVGITVALWWVVPARTSDTGSSDGVLSFRTIRRIVSTVRGGGIPLVVTIHVLLSFVSNGFLGFYPTYLVEVKGFSPQIAAVLYGLYFAVGVGIQLLVGLSKDRFGAKVTLMLVAGLFFSGVLLLQFGETILYFVFLTLLLSNRNGLGVITNTYIADTLPDEIKGSGLGLLRTSWLMTGAMSPIFVGYLGDLGRLNYAFLILAGVAGVGLFLTAFVPREGAAASS